MEPHALPPPSNPVARWLKTAVAALVGAGLLVLGFFFALFALAAGALVVTAVLIRWWWIARKLRRSRTTGQTAAETVVEGEFVVVEREGEPRSPHTP